MDDMTMIALIIIIFYLFSQLFFMQEFMAELAALSQEEYSLTIDMILGTSARQDLMLLS